MAESVHAGSDFYASRRTQLVQVHQQIRAVGTFGILPLVLGITLYLALRTPCWQSFTMLAGGTALCLCWFEAFRQIGKGNLTKAVVVLATPSLAYIFSTLVLREGTTATAIIATVALFTYISLFSNRVLIVAVALATPLYIGALVVIHLGLVPQLPQSPGRVLVQTGLYIAVFFPITAYFLRAGQRISEALHHETEQGMRRNREVLSAVERVQPELDRAITAIGPMASAFAASASQQAATSAEMSTSVDRVGRMVAETAAAAAETRGVAETIRDDATAGREKLQSLEAAFQGAVRRIEAVRGQMDELAEEVSRTEDVNRAIHDIAESLSVMGINASLEAAKAGEQGRGFAVVAQALGRMVAQTNTDLQSANKMLEHLRLRASRVAKDADASTAELRVAYDGLVAVSKLLEGITTSFANTSASVQVIAGAAEQQRAGITDLAAGVRDLAQVAGQLSEGGRGLSDGLSRVEGAHRQLREILKS